ncbi:MAG: hypothetical protein QOH35_1307 [Acidobacteriaceae bacterium]|nr:hypothetical protein [Acidobacteriaceae bacterium]
MYQPGAHGMNARRTKWIAIRDVLGDQLFRAGMALLIAFLPPARAFAQPSQPSGPAPPQAAVAPPSVATGQSRTTDLILSGEAHCGTDDTTRHECRLGDHLYVGFQNLKPWMDSNPGGVSDIALVLNGQVIRGIPPLGPDNTYKYLRFDLTRLEDDQDTSKQNRLEWNALMGDLRDDNVLHIRVATGGKAPFWGPEEKVAFQVLPRYSWVALILLLALLFFFIVLARKSDILRDSPSVNGVKQSYSLARCQMAWWFFLVAASYCYLWTVLRNRESLTQGVLILTGVSAGTGLAAAVIDANKRQQRDQLAQEKVQLTAGLTALPAAINAAPPGSTAATQLAAEQQQKSARLIEVNSGLAALPSPVGKSDGFFLDILRDETGISFHRFQMMAWTIILGLVFVSSVWRDFTMPDFSVTLLGLMGISSGTYVGFKLSSSPK